MSENHESLFVTPEDWNTDLEQVVKREGEQSQSLYWMHNASRNWAISRNDLLQIPAIIIASVTGFLSATSSLVPPVGIGALSLLVGILGTINSYFKFSQRSESHKIAAQMYLKLYKTIEVELALPAHQRANAAVLLKHLRYTMNRISEIAPPIPPKIINKFNKTFKATSVSIPIIANGIDVISVCNEDSKTKTQKIAWSESQFKVLPPFSNRVEALKSDPTATDTTIAASSITVSTSSIPIISSSTTSSSYHKLKNVSPSINSWPSALLTETVISPMTVKSAQSSNNTIKK